jgi:hypothetical protein
LLLSAGQTIAILRRDVVLNPEVDVEILFRESPLHGGYRISIAAAPTGTIT